VATDQLKETATVYTPPIQLLAVLGHLAVLGPKRKNAHDDPVHFGPSGKSGIRVRRLVEAVNGDDRVVACTVRAVPVER